MKDQIDQQIKAINSAVHDCLETVSQGTALNDATLSSMSVRVFKTKQGHVRAFARATVKQVFTGSYIEHD